MVGVSVENKRLGLPRIDLLSGGVPCPPFSIAGKCAAAGGAFFFKQWGGVRKHVTGRLLHGRTYDEMPPIITRPVADAATRERRLAVVHRWIAEAAGGSAPAL